MLDEPFILEDQKEHLLKAKQVQREIFRKMSAEKKLLLAFELYDTARELKAAYLRDKHPDWTEKQVQEKVREIFLYATT